MHESRFNIYAPSEDEYHKIVFNSLSCALAEVDATYSEIQRMMCQGTFDATKLNDAQKKVFDEGLRAHFFTNSNEEVEEYLKLREIHKNRIDRLGLTITPTLECNFKCTYCYETPKKGIMSRSTQNSIIKFIEGQAGAIKEIGVSWFGGEPILGWDVVCHLSEEMLKIASEYDIAYRSCIITNGSLLNANIVDDMKRYAISSAQITIDGPKEIHDQRRISKDGKSYFDTIITNINLLLEHGVDVAMRINVDKENVQSIKCLLAHLANTLVSKEVKIYFGRIAPYTDACSSIDDVCYSCVEFASNSIPLFGILRDLGFGDRNLLPYPTLRYVACCAGYLNSYVIDSEGNICKCWHSVGDPNFIIGNINDIGFEAHSSANIRSICNDGIDKECRQCEVLPLCGGGCIGKIENGKNVKICSPIKYNIKHVMRTYYEYSKEGMV